MDGASELTDAVAGGNADSSDVSRRELLVRGAVLGGAALALPGCGASDDAQKTGQIGGTPTRGGSIEVAYLGNGGSENLDPNLTLANVDSARSAQVYEKLFIRNPKDQTPVPQLAVDASPDASGTTWTIELIRDATWHDGKPFTAADVAHTLAYIADPDTGALGASLLPGITKSDIKARDRYTVQVTLPEPNFMFKENLASTYITIFQDGTTTKQLAERMIGTGPYKFESFKAGKTATFVRNDEFRDSKLPYLDGIEILSIADPSARVNSLVGGQTDVVAEVSGPLYSRVKNASNVNVLESESGLMPAIFMQTKTPPFDDPRVRKAMRLIIDRQQIVDNVYQGHARLGNDNAAWFDPNYAEFPQREPDPEQAKALLKEAGKEGLTFELSAADINTGLTDIATLFAAQAAKIGVKVKVAKFTTDDYFTRGYTKYPAGMTGWSAYPVSQQIAQSLIPEAPFNETQWTDNTEFNKLWKAARAEPDDAKRRDVLADAQKILYEEGGYIVPAFINNIDAASKAVGGVATGVGYPLNLANFRETFLKS